MRSSTTKPIITLVFALICATLGAATSAVIVGNFFAAAVMFTFSFAVGFFVGLVIADTLELKLNPRRGRRQKKQRIESPSRPFPERLRGFLAAFYHDADLKKSPQASRMPFWMLDSSPQPTPPKTPSFIRRQVKRIRSLIRRNRK